MYFSETVLNWLPLLYKRKEDSYRPKHNSNFVTLFKSK